MKLSSIGYFTISYLISKRTEYFLIFLASRGSFFPSGIFLFINTIPGKQHTISLNRFMGQLQNKYEKGTNMGSEEVYKNGVCQQQGNLLFYVVLCPASSGSHSAHYFGYKQQLICDIH